MKRSDEYQTSLNGRLIPVSSLTLDQAHEEICNLMDFIEELDAVAGGIKDKIQGWRNG
jgi:hypothetical protein